MDIHEFNKLPIMGIIRGIDAVDIALLVDASASAGLKALEITMNTPCAPDLIREAVSLSDGRLYIGAGTVLSMDDLKRALDAGARFIVMPVCIKEVVAFCAKNKIPVFPGAFTPNEVFAAWDAGADMVKVFPAGMFGPSYIKDLKGPLDNVKMIAVGGVREDNIEEFFMSGADAVAFGASVFKKEWIEEKNFTAIQDLISKYVEKVRSVKI